jgi:hypothetical protein
MPPEKVDVVNNDYVGKLLNSPDGWRYYNLPESNKALTTYVSKPEGALKTQGKMVTDQYGKRRESESIKYTADPRWYEFTGTDGAPVLKADQHGLLRSDVYSAITENKAFDAALTEKATNFLEHWNDPKLSQKDKEAFMTSMGIDNYAVESDGLSHKTLSAKDDPEVFNTIKRAFATHLISQNSQPSSNEKTSNTIVSVSNKTGSSSVEVPYIPAWDNLQSRFKDPKAVYIRINQGNKSTPIGLPLNTLDDATSDEIIATVNRKYPSGNPDDAKYNQENLAVRQVDGKTQVIEVLRKDVKSGTSTVSQVDGVGKVLVTLDKTSLDKNVNKGSGAKVRNQIVEDAPTTTNKISFPDWKKSHPKGTFAEYKKSI